MQTEAQVSQDEMQRIGEAHEEAAKNREEIARRLKEQIAEEAMKAREERMNAEAQAKELLPPEKKPARKIGPMSKLQSAALMALQSASLSGVQEINDLREETKKTIATIEKGMKALADEVLGALTEELIPGEKIDLSKIRQVKDATGHYLVIAE